jgi:uncharacterized protein (TIGR03437 family)
VDQRGSMKTEHLELQEGAETSLGTAGWRACSTVLLLAVAELLFCPARAVAQMRPCDPEPTNMTINYGDVVSCDISPIGDTDSFQFAGTAGQMVLIQVTKLSGAGTPYFELSDPGSIRIDAQGDRWSGIARSEAQLVKTGIYRIRVQDADDNETLTYQVFLQRAVPPLVATPISFGQPLNGNIGFAGGVDFYTFSGTAGQVVSVQVSKVGGAGTPYFEVYDPGNMRIDAQGDRWTAIVRSEVRLTGSGQYVIRVYDADVNEALSYQIFVQRLVPPLSTTAISFGQPLNGTISYVGGVDFYSFSGTAGQVVSVQVSKVGGAGTPYFEVYDPGNMRIDAQGDRWATIVRSEVRLTGSGQYVIRVYDADVNEALSYQIFVQRLVPPISITAITFGQPLNGNISFVGGVDFYSFSGTAGQVVSVQASKVGGAGTPYFEVYDPSNTRIDARGDRWTGIARSEVRLTATGDYVIRVYDADVNESVSYQIFVQRLVPPFSTTAISFGQPLNGNISFPGGVDFYTFSGTAGQVVSVQATKLGGTGTPYFEVYDPSNTLIDTRGDRWSTLARSEVRLTGTGQYVIRVYDADVNESVSYQLYVQRLVPPLSTTSLTFGQPLSGNISYPGAVEFYAFNGLMGQVVSVQITKVGGPGTPYFEVYDPSNTRIDAQGDRWTSIVRSEVRLTASGQHVIRVYDADVNESVGYQIFVQRLVPPLATTPITFGQALNGNISFAGGVDFYSFGGATGDAVTIQVTKQGGEGTPYVELYNPSNNRVAVGGDRYSNSVKIQETLTATGEYVVRIYDADVNQAYGYRIVVECSGRCQAALLRITTDSPLPEGTVGTPYSQRLEAAEGTPPYTWSIMVGSLPSGLSLSSSTGVISGTPRAAGSSNFTVRVSDNAGSAATKTFDLAIVSPSLTVSPDSLLFSYELGGSPPAPQSVSVSSGGSPISFSVTFTTASGGNWLSASPFSGTTPSSVAVSVNPTGLAAGVYTGEVTIVAGGNRQAVGVRLFVNRPEGPPQVFSLVNGASMKGGAVAPGEIVTFFGSNLGPASLMNLQLNEAGQVATTLAEVQVLFDNIPAPLLYVQASQLSAIVPYAVAGTTQAKVEVQYKGAKSNTVVAQVAASAPGIFAINASGQGQGAILNQNYTVNSAANPAEKGSVVMVYATGEGETDPQVADGRFASPEALPKPKLPVSVKIGGVEAQVLYAGGAPGSVAGLLQVNVQVPASVATGNVVPVVLTVGEKSSQEGVTMAVR